MDYIWLVGHLAFFLTAVSFMLKDIILLRSLALLSALVGIGYNFLQSGAKLVADILVIGLRYN